MTIAPATNEPLLRTLAPALRRLDQRLRAWMDSPKRRGLSTITQATFDGLSTDLQRKAVSLDVEKPLLVIMLMGGTGVGKSTLLNALAKQPIAQAAHTRPTTREPVVYFHESVRPDRLDPALQHCRLVPHDRPGLEQKVLVDTPDLDSNDMANRERLKHILPIADVVLYVGSQEKYHDQLGWELFLNHRKRRAFAFVLNKWDRCLHGVAASGLRPDEDLLRDLKDEGFQDPLIFRTNAQAWISANGQKPELPEGEQFAELEQWLEQGLTRLEIEAIKARGVGQLLQQLEKALEENKPPELGDAAERTEAAWGNQLGGEAQLMSDILLATIDPYQKEIEQHFAMEGYRRFHGLMAGFLRFVTRWRSMGTSLRSRLPRPLRGDLQSAAETSGWDLAAFSRACSSLASEKHLDARNRALPNRLLVLADTEGFPVSLLSEPTENAAKMDWRGRLSKSTLEVLHEVEGQWSRPTGVRRIVQTTLIILGDILPLLVLLGSCAFILYDYFWTDPRRLSGFWETILLPIVTTLLTLIILYIAIALLLPVRWPVIRGSFHRLLTERLREELHDVYLPLPRQVAEALREERLQIEALIASLREVSEWLRQREQAATISALYGN